MLLIVVLLCDYVYYCEGQEAVRIHVHYDTAGKVTDGAAGSTVFDNQLAPNLPFVKQLMNKGVEYWSKALNVPKVLAADNYLQFPRKCTGSYSSLQYSKYQIFGRCATVESKVNCGYSTIPDSHTLPTEYCPPPPTCYADGTCNMKVRLFDFCSFSCHLI
jgi:hypothetical protein